MGTDPLNPRDRKQPTRKTSQPRRAKTDTGRKDPPPLRPPKKTSRAFKKPKHNHARQPVGESAELRPQPTASPRTLLHRRPDRVRQQPDRKRSSADKARHEKPFFAKATTARLDVHRRSRHRMAQRRDLHDGRTSKTPRPRPIRLPQMGVRASTRDDQPRRLRPTPSKQLDRGAESAARKSGIDGRDAIALAKMLERLR